ncbi:hypothetical protein [uncultured Clostridium sp.]|uniref:hypothetical protein n=1 Tax=uncultured Clostridium sp. TaxID=59620 RepID=UPI00258ABB28|nr:hypothetical protein [uncultured Clostridium sp.]
MTQISSFFDANMVNGVPDREYDATSWANYFKGIIGNGVSITPSSNLQVVAGTGLNVILSPGIAYINGYYYNNTEPLTVPINIANATYPRITSIVIELSLNNREIICKTVDGSAQSTPTAPQITQTESTYQLQLATVYVPAGATAIGTITDTRENSALCGYMQMLAPTIPPAFLANLTLQGTIKNDATIIGGTYKNSCVEDTGINSCGISDSTLIGSICNKGTINNYGTINGGTISNVTLDNVNITGDVNNYTTISGGSYNNPTLQGTITNKGTFNNNNSHIVGGSVHNIQIVNADLLGKVLNLTSIQGGTYNDPTLTGKVNINDGLFNNGNPIVNASSLNINNIHVQDNVTGRINLEYWALNAGLLSANTNNLTCGIIKASITLDSNCTWNNRNPIYLNVEGFPNANAMTVTYQKNFVVGCGQNVIVLNGNNAYLNANQTYTEYALIYG